MAPRLRGEFWGGRVGAGLLVMRLIFGTALVGHGLQKWSAPTAWLTPYMPDVAPLWQFLVFAGEIAGGLALLIGFLTPISAFCVAGMMLGAGFFVHAADPWVASAASGPSKEPSLLYLGFALLLITAGPGLFSLDAWLFHRKKPR